MNAPLRPSLDLALLQQRVRDLPTLPQAAMDALALLRDNGSRVQDCAERLACDPALTARVLGLANSAFFGARGKVSSVEGAIQVLGRRSVIALLSTATVSQAMAAPQDGSFDLRGFWRHTLSTALAAQGLARELGADDALAFTTGLLHDIGTLALATHFPADTEAVAQWGRSHDVASLSAEQAVLGPGIDHTQVGGLIAVHWHFPSAVTEAIRGHHAPSALATPGTDPGHAEASKLCDIVHVAEAMSHALDLNSDANERVPPLDINAWTRLGLGSAAVLRVLAHAEGGTHELADALGL